jgi:uncharacterized damage-inducible protein DinB
MDILRSLYAHHAWANGRVFNTCLAVDRQQLDEQAPGTYGTLARTLQHLVVVEDAYAHMLRGDSLDRVASRDDHDLEWFAQRSAQLGQEYLHILARADEGFYAAPLNVPWFEFPLTKRDGLLQVLSHSAQHRAQTFSVLGAHGVEVPDLDYVLYVEEQTTGNSEGRA